MGEKIVKKNLLIAFCIIVFLLVSCKPQVADPIEVSVKPTSGYFVKNRYVNEFLGFTINYPDKWFIVGNNGKETQMLLEEVSKFTYDSEPDQEAFLDFMNETTLVMLLASKYPQYTEGVLNQNILIMSENLSEYNNPTLEDYIEATKVTLNADNLYKTMDMPDENIDGVKFRKFSAYTDAYTVDIYQIYYITIINNYSLGIVLSYFDDESLADLNNIISTIDFE